MIHPNYSLQLLDILLKTKSDEKYTQANEADQQEAMRLPIVANVEKRTAKLLNYSYTSSAFVPIDSDIEKYLSKDTAPVLSSLKSTEEEAKAEAIEALNSKITSLKTKNIYKRDNFDTTEYEIEVPISTIDATQMNRLKPAFAPIGSRVLNMKFNDVDPTKEEQSDESITGKYTVSFDWCYLGDTINMVDFFNKQINNIKDAFEKELKTLTSYAASESEPYYTSKDGVGYPIHEETLTVKINATNIYQVTKTMYQGYTYKKSGDTSSVVYIQSSITYYTLVVSEVPVTTSLKSWVYSQVFGANDGGAYYPKKAFIGLFTKMPDAYGKEFEEPTWKTNDNLHTYQRISLHEDLLYGDMSLNQVRQIGADNEEYPNDAIEHSDYLGYAFVDNKEIVLFPEILDEDGWGEIIGFGLFENEERTEGETPYFWGRITNEKGEATSVLTGKEKVPLFRKNEFKIYLG